MKVKKSVQRIVFVLAICAIGLAYIIIAREEQCLNFDKKASQIPLPDKILIYKNGYSYEVDPSSKDFTKIYKSCNEIRNQSTMESAIDNDIVEEIKSQIAVEYVYSEKKNMKLNDYEREYTKLLFNLEGQDNVILYDSGYKSGTYKLGVNKLLLKARLQSILRVGYRKNDTFSDIKKAERANVSFDISDPGYDFEGDDIEKIIALIKPETWEKGTLTLELSAIEHIIFYKENMKYVVAIRDVENDEVLFELYSATNGKWNSDSCYYKTDAVVKRHIVGGGNSRLFSAHPPLLIVWYQCRPQFGIGTTADCCGFV